MISHTFDTFAKEILGTERSKLTFLFQQKRVFGYESPVALGLKYDGNIIHAVDADTYRCENCVCCNPQLNQVDVNDTGKQDALGKENCSDDASVDY